MTFTGVTNEQLKGKKNTPEFHQECIERTKDTPLKMRDASTLDHKVYDFQGTYIEFVAWVDVPGNCWNILNHICRCDSDIYTSEGYRFELLFDMHYGPQLTLQSFPE